MRSRDAHKQPRRNGLPVPARVIPAPTSVSSKAQAFLSRPADLGFPREPADPNDKAGWRDYVVTGNARLAAMMSETVKSFPARIVEHRISHTCVYEIAPETLQDDADDRAIFYVHGGAYILGAGLAGAQMGLPLSSLAKIRAFSVDYRMPPDHPFPVGLDDAVEGYRWLLQRYAPEKVVVFGLSAGGGLAAAFLLKARDLGLPMPAACVLATPEADLTESGDTFETNDTIDVVQGRLTTSIAVYADGHDLRDPYLSPLFGDFTKGFPPTMLTTGTRDLFLSNTVRFHRALLKAGVEAELHVWEAMPHGGFFGAPEDQEVLLAHVGYMVRSLKR